MTILYLGIHISVTTHLAKTPKTRLTSSSLAPSKSSSTHHPPYSPATCTKGSARGKSGCQFASRSLRTLQVRKSSGEVGETHDLLVTVGEELVFEQKVSGRESTEDLLHEYFGWLDDGTVLVRSEGSFTQPLSAQSREKIERTCAK